MLQVLLGIIILAALGVVVFAVVRSRRGDSSSVDDRLGRYGMVRDPVADKEALKEARKSFLARRLDKAMGESTYADVVAAKLARADLKLTPGEFVMFKVITAIGALALGAFMGRTAGPLAFLVGLAFAVPGSFIPDLYANIQAGQRTKKFNDQLGDTIVLLANSLRSGYSLLQGMELVSREASPPMSAEFLRVVREVGLGITHQEAFSNLLRRMPSEDLDLLITAINIQHEVGGNLAQILDTISHTIRERVRIKGEISVLTAQGQLSAYIITLMPPGLGVLLFMINPSYMSQILVWPWLCMPIGAAIMVSIGFFAMQKIVTIEV